MTKAPRIRPKPQASPQSTRGGGRAQKTAARREAILAAALDEFAAQGFAATRLDDVARRAGVAKGTIYLHFRDKEALFQDLVRSVLSPLVGMLETIAQTDAPLRSLAERIVEVFVSEIYGTRRKDVIRLIITEGPTRSSAASSRARPFSGSRSCWSRPASSRSSGAGCSTASSRSTCAR